MSIKDGVKINRNQNRVDEKQQKRPARKDNHTLETMFMPVSVIRLFLSASEGNANNQKRPVKANIARKQKETEKSSASLKALVSYRDKEKRKQKENQR